MVNINNITNNDLSPQHVRNPDPALDQPKNNELVRTGMNVNEHERLSTLHLDINKSKGKGVCINI